MGNTQSHVVASLSLCALYFVYAKVYRSHYLLKTKHLHWDRLPSFSYLFLRYLYGLLRGTAVCSSSLSKEETTLEYTVHGCRLDRLLLRRFCSAAGYGWDYPDSEHRDVPLCFPEVLCFKLLLTLLTDADFKLSPAGLVCVRQSIRTQEPVDELKKGPFQLRGSVLVYRVVSGGTEADIALSATSPTQRLVWESVLTLMSPKKGHREAPAAPLSHREEPRDEQLDQRQVELKVPTFPTMPCSLSRLVSAVCGLKPLVTSRLWMLSVCLAEIEKHQGPSSGEQKACVWSLRPGLMVYRAALGGRPQGQIQTPGGLCLGPRLWNKWPSEMRTLSDFSFFKARIETDGFKH